MPDRSSPRARSLRFVDAASTLLAAAVGLALIFAAATQLLRPVAIAPLTAAAMGPLVAVPTSRSLTGGRAVAHRVLDPRPPRRDSPRMTKATRPPSRGVVAWREAGPVTPHRATPRARRPATPRSPTHRPVTVAKIHGIAPPATRRSERPRTSAVAGAHVAFVPARAAHGAAVPRPSRRRAAPRGEAFAVPEPPLGFDARPDFVGASAVAGSAGASIEGLRLRGRPLASPAAASVVP